MIEGMSKLVRSKSCRSLSSFATTSTATSPRAATPKNSTRQPITSISAPETGGPMAGAKLMTTPTSPMTCPRCSMGVVSNTSVKTMGMMMPPAHACKTRPRMSTPNVGPMATTNEPTANSTRAPAKSLRVENLPRKNALRGMITASTREYTDVSHWTVVSVTCISRMMTGSAGASSV